MRTEKSEIKLIMTLKGNETTSLKYPEMGAYYGALGCFEEHSSFELAENNNKKLSSVKTLFQETAGRGHGSVLDQSSFVWSMKNVPRTTTLFLCGPQYLEHLQQSLRRAKADKGFYISKLFDQTDSVVKRNIELQHDAFALYEKMVSQNIPSEDGRYILPLNTYTNIQTKGNARELMHLLYMSDYSNIPLNTKNTIKNMYKLAENEAPNLLQYNENSFQVKAWYPSLQLFTDSNPLVDMLSDVHNTNVSYLDCASIPGICDDLIENCKNGDETSLSVLKHIHFTFYVNFSLAAFHQAIRQRTWDISCESIFHAIKSPTFTIPPSIKNHNLCNEYQNLAEEMVISTKEMMKEYPRGEVIGSIPHSLNIGSLIHINGWNALHAIGKRRCTKAQWDIRKKADLIAKIIIEKAPYMNTLVGAQCKVYGKCPEKKSCNKIKIYQK